MIAPLQTVLIVVSLVIAVVAVVQVVLNRPIGAVLLTGLLALTLGLILQAGIGVVQVVRDDSTTTVTTRRSGGTRTVTAVVADQDSGSGVGYGAVTLLADGVEVASTNADQQGTAVFTPTGRAKSAKEYEVRFDGDERYEASSGRVTP